MCKTIISLLICAVLQVLSLSAGNVSFGKLTVEGWENPIGIDDLSPRFGWQLRSTANGTMQQSYRLLVASSMKSCEIGKADIWDSKEIKSDESQWIEYEGPALSPTTQYYWRVIMKTANGNAVSDIHYWTTGLINSENWAGHWIGCDSITPDVVMERFASLLNLKDDSVYFANEATAMTSAINSQFLNNGNYANGTVTANLLPLAFDIAPDSLRNTIERNMLARQGENIDCGVIGISWLMRYLSRNGNGNLAYRIASTTEYPGWGYMIANGATTIWELWNGNTANPSMNSGNHVMMLGDFIPWTFECLGGIAPDYEKPGFRHIIMKPVFFITAIKGVDAAYPSIYGEIISEWHRINDCIEWHVEIPCNTTATLYFHDGSSREINIGKYTFKNL